MSHQNLEKMTSTALMLPKDNSSEEKIVFIAQNNGVGKILLREDTVLANLQGCAGCGRAQFACAGVKKQWSALCWGRQSEKKYYCLMVLLTATFILSLLGTIFLCFTNSINSVILSNMAIRNNSMSFAMWRRPTVRPLMKVHLFNYTNWQDVRNGYAEKLHVQDVGPYVYSQQIERVNLKFQDDKLTFQERNTFRFLPEKTNGTQFDKVYVPNLPLLGAIAKAIDLNLNTISQFSLNSALNWANHPNAFLEAPVARFLWGYDDSIVNSVKTILSLQGQLKFDKFGLLVTKNGTVADVLTINTGEKNIDRMNIFEKFDGHVHLPYWGSQECNSIESTDGSIFPPSLLDRKTVLHVLFPNLCRRLPFIYDKDVESVDGIQLLRYRMPPNVFDDHVNNPANECYCEIDSGTCPKRGVINVTVCAMGAPILVSFPHFHLGDPSLREDITGLDPKSVDFDSYMDIHPSLGITLNGKSSLQLNIEVKKTPLFTALSYLKPGTILPIAWIEMSIEELPDSVKSLVYHGTYSTAAAQLGLTVTCIIALIVSGVCLFCMFVTRKRKPCATLKKIPVETELKNQMS